MNDTELDLTGINTEASVNRDFISALTTMGDYREAVLNGSYKFSDVVEKIISDRKIAPQIKKMFGFAAIYAEKGFEEAIEDIKDEDGTNIQIRALNNNGGEDLISGKIIYISGYSSESAIATAEGIAQIRKDSGEKDFVAVRVSKTGESFLNPVHRQALNNGKPGKQVVKEYLATGRSI